MNRRFVFAIAASAIFGLLAIFVFQRILQKQVIDARNNLQYQFVAPLTKIPVGTVIAQNQVKVNPSLSPPPEGSFRSLQDVVGKVAQVELLANMPIVAGNIALPNESSLQHKVEKGYRAVAIRVDEATSVAGFATPGSYVDVGAAITPTANSRTIGQVLVQNLRVLANGKETQARPELQGRTGNTVTLEVTPVQAETLTLAMREGPLHLYLRNPRDREVGMIPPVAMINVVEEVRNDGGSRSAAPTPQPTPFDPRWGNPSPTLKATPSPTPTASPMQKMAAVRIIAGVSSSEVTVRQ
jgi:Flp pilus assembly protein CpaB